MKKNRKRIIAITSIVVVLALAVAGVCMLVSGRDKGKEKTNPEKSKVELVKKDEPKKEPEREPEKEPEIVDKDETKNEESTKEPEAPTDSSKVETIPGQHRDPNRIVVVIDPGHQRHGESAKEPNGPGSSVMKARVTSGTSGKYTGVAEYILNLQVSLKLKTELQNRGYTVYMTRESHDVSISNMERAQYATTVGADIAVRIHANGSTNPAVQGALTMAPSSGNPYVGHLANASYNLSKNIIDAYCAATGFENDGVLLSDTMTGINWSTVPVTIVEMGYMSNEQDDRAMQDATMQNNMVQGIANGIDAYFGL